MRAPWPDFAVYMLRVLYANGGLCGLAPGEHRAIHREWLAARATGRSPLELELPWITVAAKRVLEALLSNQDPLRMRAFEYGSGGSTFFLRRFAAEVVSVEHDAVWHRAVREHACAVGAEPGSIHLVEPERGAAAPTSAELSDPAAYRSADPAFADATFRAYASFIDCYPRGHFDLVLVDGRSRPACLAHGGDRLRSGGLLVLDNAERGYYLAAGVLAPERFELLFSCHGALVASKGFTRTSIYRKRGE